MAIRLQVDVTLNNTLAIINTKLLADYCAIDGRLTQLAFIVKHWAKRRQVRCSSLLRSALPWCDRQTVHNDILTILLLLWRHTRSTASSLWRRVPSILHDFVLPGLWHTYFQMCSQARPLVLGR